MTAKDEYMNKIFGDGAADLLKKGDVATLVARLRERGITAKSAETQSLSTPVDMTQFGELVTQLVTDQFTLLERQDTLEKQVSERTKAADSLVLVVKAQADELTALKTKLDDVEKVLALGATPASKADATKVDEDDPAVAEAKKNVADYDPVFAQFGLPVPLGGAK